MKEIQLKPAEEKPVCLIKKSEGVLTYFLPGLATPTEQARLRPTSSIRKPRFIFRGTGLAIVPPSEPTTETGTWTALTRQREASLGRQVEDLF